VCEEDGTIPPEGQEQMVRAWPGEDVIRLPSGHSPFFSQPDRLVAILDGLTR
jgi:pimeloyl-ACP methyl ester carboxylesterase